VGPNLGEQKRAKETKRESKDRASLRVIARSRFRIQIPKSKIQTPSSKLQAPNKHQAPSSKLQTARIGSWCLELLWILDLGVWILALVLPHIRKLFMATVLTDGDRLTRIEISRCPTLFPLFASVQTCPMLIHTRPKKKPRWMAEYTHSFSFVHHPVRGSSQETFAEFEKRQHEGVTTTQLCLGRLSVNTTTPPRSFFPEFFPRWAKFFRPRIATRSGVHPNQRTLSPTLR